MNTASEVKSKHVAIVTGASSGIGQAISNELVQQHFHVYAIARSLDDYFTNPGCERLVGTGYLRPVRLDVTDQVRVGQVINQIIEIEGQIDYLVQAAGYGLAGAIEDTASDEAKAQLDTNFFGAIHALPPVLQQMRKQQHGLIVQMGSVAGFLPIPFQAYYSAGKAALAALTLALADEVRPWGIRCLIIQAGDTNTGFTKARIKAARSISSDYLDRFNRSIDKMAADETGGAAASLVARKIVRQMMRRNPPLIYTPGMLYKVADVLNRLLPTRLVRAIINLMYAS